MRTLQVIISPVLDNLIKRLGRTTWEEDIESIALGYRKSFGGQTWDFAGYREYTLTDDSNLIDWKASIRDNKLIIREYLTLRLISAFFLFDVSSTMLLGTTEKLKLEYGAEVIATLANSILKAGGKVGLGIFNDRLIKVLPSSQGINQFHLIMKILTNERLFGGACSLQNTLKSTLPFLKSDTLFIIVSDFLNLGENWQNSIKAVSTKYNTLGIMIRDPIDRELPKGIHKIFIQNPITGKKHLFYIGKHLERYKKKKKRQEESITNLFHSLNADFLILPTNKPYLHDLINFIKRREKKFQ